MSRAARVSLITLGVFTAWSIAGTQLCAAALAAVFVGRRSFKLATPVRDQTLAFVGVCAASVVFSGMPLGSFDATAWKPALLVWIAAATVVQLGAGVAEEAVMAWVGAAAVASAWGCFQAATGDDLLFLLHLRSAPVVIPSPSWPGHAAAAGFFNSRLTFSLALMPALGCAGGLAARGTGWRRWAGAASASVMLAAMALGFVRAAWWGAMLAGATVIALGPRRMRLPAAGLAAASVVVLLAIPQVRARALSGLRVSDNEDRVFIWARASEVIAAHPVLGVGFGAYPRAAEPFYDRANPAFPMHTWAHDTPLSLLAEVGPLGLLLYLLLWGAVLVAGWPAVKSGSAVALGLLAGVAGLHLASLFHDILYNGEVAFALYLAGGLLAGLGLNGAPPRARS